MIAHRQKRVAIFRKKYDLINAIATRPGVTGCAIADGLQRHVFAFTNGYSWVRVADHLAQIVENQGFNQCIGRWVYFHFHRRRRIGASVCIRKGDFVGTFFGGGQGLRGRVTSIGP